MPLSRLPQFFEVVSDEVDQLGDVFVVHALREVMKVPSACPRSINQSNGDRTMC